MIDRRHRMDAELLPVPLALAHLVGVARRNRAPRAARSPSRPLSAAARSSTSRAPGFSAAVIRREERVLEARLPSRAFEPGPVQQAVRIERVPDARPLAEREAHRGAALAQRGAVLAPAARAAAVLAREVLDGVLALGRHCGLSSNGSKCSVDGHLVAQAGERRFERAQADGAPGAGDVGNEFDLHGGERKCGEQSSDSSDPAKMGALPQNERPFPHRGVARVRSLECPAPCSQDPLNDLRRHPHSRRTSAQPQEPRSRPPHRRDDGRDRAERLGQVEPRVRHAVRGRPAPLRRDLQRLRAPVPRPHGPARGRRVDGVPPAIAIDQTNPVRSSRSTVGTMTELNDHLKLLFARAAELFDKQTGAARAPRHAGDDLRRADGARAAPKAAATIRASSSRSRSSCPDTERDEIEQWLAASGFTRVQAEREVASPTGPRKCSTSSPTASASRAPRSSRAIEAIETALKRGAGRVNVYVPRRGPKARAGRAELWRFSTGLHCPDSDCRYADRSRRSSRSTRPTARARPAAASAA